MKYYSTFDWESLNGKTVDVSVGKDEGDNPSCIYVILFEKEGGNAYLVHCHNTEEIPE